MYPSDTKAAPPGEITLGRWSFRFMATLAPERDASGGVVETSPQERYKRRATVPLDKHGHGTFCKFRISAPRGLAGVYALAVDAEVCYIGECVGLRCRFNAGYGNISPRNCYKGGQPTNCKINRWVLEMSKGGRRVSLYFHATAERKAVERLLIAQYHPSWNV